MFTLDPSTLPLKKGLRVAYNSFTHVTLINTLVYLSFVCNQALRALGHSTTPPIFVASWQKEDIYGLALDLRRSMANRKVTRARLSSFVVSQPTECHNLLTS